MVKTYLPAGAAGDSVCVGISTSSPQAYAERAKAATSANDSIKAITFFTLGASYLNLT